MRIIAVAFAFLIASPSFASNKSSMAKSSRQEATPVVGVPAGCPAKDGDLGKANMKKFFGSYQDWAAVIPGSLKPSSKTDGVGAVNIKVNFANLTASNFTVDVVNKNTQVETKVANVPISKMAFSGCTLQFHLAYTVPGATQPMDVAVTMNRGGTATSPRMEVALKLMIGNPIKAELAPTTIIRREGSLPAGTIPPEPADTTDVES